MHTELTPDAAPAAPSAVKRSLLEKAMRALVGFITHQDFLRCMMLAIACLSWAWRVVCLVVTTWLIFGPRDMTAWLYLAAWLLMIFADPMRPLMGALAREVRR